MKKSLVLIVAAILMLSLFGCSDKKNADVSGVVDAPDKFSTLDEAKVTENPNIRTVRPLRDGVIADFNACEQMMRGLIKKVNTGPEPVRFNNA